MKQLSIYVFAFMAFASSAYSSSMVCGVVKNGSISKYDQVEISLTEPLFARIKTTENENGTLSSRRTQFITSDYVSTWKINRDCKAPCVCNIEQTETTYAFTATCNGASATLMMDLVKNDGYYFEEFRPTHTTRTIPFKDCIEN